MHVGSKMTSHTGRAHGLHGLAVCLFRLATLKKKSLIKEQLMLRYTNCTQTLSAVFCLEVGNDSLLKKRFLKLQHMDGHHFLSSVWYSPLGKSKKMLDFSWRTAQSYNNGAWSNILEMSGERHPLLTWMMIKHPVSLRKNYWRLPWYSRQTV